MLTRTESSHTSASSHTLDQQAPTEMLEEVDPDAGPVIQEDADEPFSPVHTQLEEVLHDLHEMEKDLEIQVRTYDLRLSDLEEDAEKSGSAQTNELRSPPLLPPLPPPPHAPTLGPVGPPSSIEAIMASRSMAEAASWTDSGDNYKSMVETASWAGRTMRTVRQFFSFSKEASRSKSPSPSAEDAASAPAQEAGPGSEATFGT
ncbi:unnamed protein product [Symbiodinium natans]|uniref:Uncharacterized protein n=1 Tax=Symbiodinium natans TaxID=878477 RepID=A0A812M4F9_9DINO|nr:unnamed protein product [Symbiodinium natans]